MTRNKKGFTLVELVIVIAVIAILAGVMIAVFSGVVKRANESAELQKIKNEELAQKADDILKKVDNANWFSWEDFENSLAEKLTETYKKYAKNEGGATAEQIEAAVKKAIAEYAANTATENTSLTEAQVKAIVENALAKASLGGVTEAQVRTIVNTAVAGVNTVSKAQVQSIVDAAVAKGLTADQVAQAIVNANLAKKSDVETVSQKVDTAIAAINALNPVTNKDLEDKIIELLPVTKTAADATEFAELVGRLNSGSTIIVGWDASSASLTIGPEAGDKTLTIKGNDIGTLTINAPKATIYLLADVDTVDVVETAQYSVHVLGKVESLTIRKGRAVLEEGAVVQTLKAAPSINATVVVALEAGASITEKLETEYQEHGFVDGNRDFIYIENNGDVALTKLTASAALQNPSAVHTTTNVVITNGTSGSRIAETNIQIDNTNPVSDDTLIKIDDTTGYVEGNEVVTFTSDFAGGDGLTAETAFEIVDYDTFQKVSDYYDQGYYYFKVKDGIEYIDCSNWVSVKLHGSFDGNGVKLMNVTACLFSMVGYKLNNENITLKNFDATMNVSSNGEYGAAALIKNIFNSGKTTFNNVDVHGYLEGFWNMGSYFNYGTANYDGKGADYEVEFINCKSDVTMVCASGNTIGGLFGHAYEGTNNSFTLRVDADTEYTGTMYLTTSSGKGNKYFGMTSDYNNAHNHFYFNGVEDTFDNGNSKNSGAYTNSVKISNVVAQKGEDAYTIAKQADATKIVVTITAQLTAYDAENNKIPNLSGITMVLSSKNIADISGDTVKVFDLFDEVEFVDSKGNYDVRVDEGTLLVYIDEDMNYKTGNIRIQVNQYNAGGEIISAGTKDIAVASTIDNWTVN